MAGLEAQAAGVMQDTGVLGRGPSLGGLEEFAATSHKLCEPLEPGENPVPGQAEGTPLPWQHGGAGEPWGKPGARGHSQAQTWQPLG